MLWSEKCLMELTHHNMFDSAEHRLRFRDLVDCYYRAPFFTKGLCKCMYLSCFDDVHFDIMLSMLNELTIDSAKSLRAMREQGQVLLEDMPPEEREVQKLANSFLGDGYYQVPDYADIDPDTAHILRRGILAAAYIDDLPDPQVKNEPAVQW